MGAHVYDTCSRECDNPHCIICIGGLAVCLVCGGAEGSLLPECPGRQLSGAELDAIYRDYCDGTGPFAPSQKEETR